MAFTEQELFVNEGLCSLDGEFLSPLERLSDKGYADSLREVAHLFFDEPIDGVVSGVALVRALVNRADVVGLPISLVALSTYLDVDVAEIEARLLVQKFRDLIRDCGLALFESDLIEKDGEILSCLEIGWREIVEATRTELESCSVAECEPALEESALDPDDECPFGKRSPYRLVFEKLEEICGSRLLVKQALEWILENYDEELGGVCYKLFTDRFRVFNKARILKANEETLMPFGLEMILDSDTLRLRFL